MHKIYKVIDRKKLSMREIITIGGIYTEIAALTIAGIMGSIMFTNMMMDYAKNNCDFLSEEDNINTKETYSEDKITRLKDQVSNEYKNLINMVNLNKTIIEGNDELSMRIEAEYSDYSNCSSIKRNYSDTELINIATSYYTMENYLLNEELDQYKLQLDNNLITAEVYNSNYLTIYKQIVSYQNIINDLGKEYINIYGKTKVLS